MRHFIIFLFISLCFVLNLKAQSKFLDVNGSLMHLETAGLENRVNGQPVIIFESPSLGTISDWDSIFYEAADIAPVVRYDRSGLGESEWNGKKPSPENIAIDLLEMLETLGIDPPYILVGHSWGTQLIRRFAHLYPEKAKGLIIIDPGLRPVSFKAALKDIGSPAEEGFQSYLDILEGDKFNSNFTDEEVQHLKAMREWFVSPDYPPAPQIPVAALLAGKPGPGPPFLEDLPFNYGEWIIALNRREMERLISWTLDSPDGIFILADQSGHFIQHDEPDLVLTAIQNVVGKSQNSSE